MRSPRLRNLLASGVLFTTVILTAGGCKDNQSLLFVRSVLFRKPGQCDVTADPTSLMRLSGVLDLALRSDYTAPLLVGNQLVVRGSRDRLRTESSRIILRGAVVRVTDPAGHKLAEYTTDGTGFVDPGSGDAVGYGIMTAQLIPPNLQIPAGTSQVVAAVSVFGDTLGGREVTSSELSFPITLCRGCLVSFPVSAVDPVSNTCTGTDAPSDPVPCAVGQDDPIDCRYCAKSVAVCSAPGS